jgi:Short C-terminal domain/PEGA domain
MKKRCIDFICCFLVIAILFPGCTSTTLIQSTPKMSKVYIDGEFVGETPYIYSDSRILGSSVSIKIEKDGYQPLITNMTRNEEVDLGAIVGGVFFLVPFLWTLKYKPSHSYELKPLGEGVSSGSSNVESMQKSTADKLRELKKLVDEGVITQAEFDKEKAKILEAN